MYWPPTIPLTPVAVASSAAAASSVRRARPSGARQQVAERLGVEAVAGQDRDVLAVLDVAGRAAAAQVVVVHRRQVVVDQASRCGSARARRRAGARSRASRPSALRGRERQHRPDALAAGQQRVAHGLLQALGAGLLGEAQRRRGTPRPARAGGPGSSQLERELARRARPASAERTSRSSSAPASAARRAHSSTSAAARSGVEVAGAQLGGGALEALDDPVEGFRRHARRHSRAPRAGPHRGCR